MTALLYTPQLPWTTFREDARRFARVNGMVLPATVVLAIVVPLITAPVPEPDPETEAPPRVVRVLLDDPVRVEADISPVRDGEIGVKKPVSKEPVVAEIDAAGDRTEPAPRVQPGGNASDGSDNPGQEPPRTKARDAGVLDLRDTLAALQARPTELAAAGAQSRQNLRSSEPVATARSSLVSDGADEAKVGRSVTEVDESRLAVARLQQRNTALSSPTQGSAAAVPSTTSRKVNDKGSATRSQEEIQEILDRHKGYIYALYNRELESNPTLRGRVVLSLSIAPSGKVVACRIQDSELGAPSFESRVVRHIKGIDFGPKTGAPSVTTTVPIEFLPT